jgi:cell cycle sensor histidine kinase DivJ
LVRDWLIFKQLHTVNHDLERSVNLSLFWNFAARSAAAAAAFYSFLKPGMRFSGGDILKFRDEGRAALRVLRDIMGKALSFKGSDKARTGSRHAFYGPAKLVPAHLAFAAAVSLASLPLMALCGLAWSSMLPAATSLFAALLTICLAWREKWPGLSEKGNDPTIQASPFAETSLLDRLPGLITRHDAAGLLVSVHGADRKAFGLAGYHCAPAAYIDSVHVGGRIAFLSAVDELRQGARRAEAEFLFSAGGVESAYRPMRVVLSPERDAQGRFSGFLAQTCDIAGEVALRNEASARKAEACSANDAKTRFLAAVSHELRTPLNAILGFSDILMGEYFGRFENERQKEYVALINQSGHHLLDVVNTMLDMSKIEAGRYELIKEPFHIADAVRTVDEMLALQAKTKGVVLTTRIARGMDDVVADRRAIQQILINLANNAIKFTDEGGVVTIDALADRGNLKITISDTGIGIPAEKLALIGTPFMQVQSDYARRYEGTGLGLALVKGLVSLHGGSFVIESQEGVGTVITVTVPINGEGDAGAETFEFPPRLQEKTIENKTGETRHGAAEAKIA